ncbi:MAG: transposase, partial [Thermoplasmata archaeon]
MRSSLRRHDEPGHVHFWTISCYRRLQFFHDDGMKRVIIEALRTLHGKLGVCLVGYLVMPEHVHVLLYPHRRGDDEPIPIGGVLQAFKQHIGRHGKERLRDVWRREGRVAREGPARVCWQTGTNGVGCCERLRRQHPETRTCQTPNRRITTPLNRPPTGPVNFRP